VSAICTHSASTHRPDPPRAQRLGRFAWWGVAAWAGETLLLWAGLRSLTSSHAPLHVPMLDLASYAGYTFVSVSVQCVVGLFSRRGYYFMLLWGSLATAIFLVKTLKRIRARLCEDGLTAGR